MAKYKYAGVTAEGAAVNGVVDADHVNDARVALAEKGLYGLRVKERPSFWKMEISKKKVKRAEIMNFSRQLAAFVRAGIPILDAIDTLRAEAGNEQFRTVLAEVSEALRTGETFSNSIAAHPEVFPSFYVTILRSAEMTGHVDSVLDQLATYIERDEIARRKIKSAMTYPLVIMAVAVVAVIVIVTFALPRFRDFFSSLNAKLPLVTRILLSITNFMGDYWWFLLGGFVAIAGGLFIYLKTERGRRRRDKVVLRIPVLRDLVRFSIVERFCRILGSMVKSGVQVPDAMAIASGSTNNTVYQDALEGAREAMLRGEGMSEPITATGLFPGGVCQMIRVGEDTGTLDDQLETAAGFYGKEVEYKIDKLTALFEPMMILFVGVIVGFVAIALVSAMYGIFGQVKVK